MLKQQNMPLSKTDELHMNIKKAMNTTLDSDVDMCSLAELKIHTKRKNYWWKYEHISEERESKQHRRFDLFLFISSIQDLYGMRMWMML